MYCVQVIVGVLCTHCCLCYIYVNICSYIYALNGSKFPVCCSLSGTCRSLVNLVNKRRCRKTIIMLERVQYSIDLIVNKKPVINTIICKVYWTLSRPSFYVIQWLTGLGPQAQYRLEGPTSSPELVHSLRNHLQLYSIQYKVFFVQVGYCSEFL